MGGNPDYTKSIVLKAMGSSGLVTVGCTDDGYLKVLLHALNDNDEPIPLHCDSHGYLYAVDPLA